jgi:hypothetical protein
MDCIICNYMVKAILASWMPSTQFPQYPEREQSSNLLSQHASKSVMGVPNGLAGTQFSNQTG